MISRPRLVALALTAAAVVTQLQVGSADVLEQVLVKVNGDILTKTELEAKQIAAIRGRINSAVDADSMKNDDTLKKMIAEVTPKILVDTIDEMLLIQLGKEKGYHVTDQQFKDWLTQLRKDQNLEDENKFKAALAQEGMTMDDLRKNFEKQVTVYRVQQDEVGQKLQITEEEARQYYLAHQSEFVEAPTVTLREISIEIPTSTQGGQAGINVAQDDQAKQKIDAIRARVTAGEESEAAAENVENVDEDAVDDDDRKDDEGPVHRPLIRASLPREGQPPPARPIPEFTIRQPGGRPNRFRPRHPGGGGQPFRGDRSNGNGFGGQGGQGNPGNPGNPGNQRRAGSRPGGGRPPQGAMPSRLARRHGPGGRKRQK